MAIQAGLPFRDGENAAGATVAVPGANPDGCKWCQGRLTGKQTDFCSKACNGAWYNAHFPRINRTDLGKRTGTLKAAILTFLREHPGEHTEQQIADAIHAFSHSVGARLSELRRAGEPIESRKGPGNVKLYRLKR